MQDIVLQVVDATMVAKRKAFYDAMERYYQAKRLYAAQLPLEQVLLFVRCTVPQLTAL